MKKILRSLSVTASLAFGLTGCDEGDSEPGADDSEDSVWFRTVVDNDWKLNDWKLNDWKLNGVGLNKDVGLICRPRTGT